MNRKDLRIKILRAHYELSDGSQNTPVMRQNIAEELNIENFNDPKLIDGIQYLKDKGFLQSMTNVEDCITTEGIDEVEEGCPSLLGTEHKDLYVSAGQPFTGTKYLEQILNTAKEKVWIVDNYFHSDFLKLMQSVITDKNLEIKILIGKKQKSTKKQSLSKYINKFKEEEGTHIEAREQDPKTYFHDRFIIIDELKVYQSGHSLHDIGNKSSYISEVTDQDDSEKVINDFCLCWSNSISF